MEFLNNNDYEMKRNNRFQVELFPILRNLIANGKFNGLSNPYISPQFITVIDKPNYSLINNKWKNMEIVFQDPISPLVAYPIFQLMDSIKNENKFLKFIRGSKYKNKLDLKIKMLDPVGTIVEIWHIYFEILSFDFGRLDTIDARASEVRLLIKPTKCLLVED